MLLDVTALDPGGLTTLDGWIPSREGDRLAHLLYLFTTQRRAEVAIIPLVDQLAFIAQATEPDRT